MNHVLVYVTVTWPDEQVEEWEPMRFESRAAADEFIEQLKATFPNVIVSG